MPGRSGGQTPAATNSARSGKRDNSPPTSVPSLMPGARVHHQARRLVHHDHLGVGVDDPELHAGLRLDALVAASGRRMVSVAPSRSGCRPTVDHHPVDQDPPGSDELGGSRRETSASMATARSTRTPARRAGTSDRLARPRRHRLACVGLAPVLMRRSPRCTSARPPKSRAATTTTTPTVTQASATLKVGQWLSVM